MAIIHLLQSTVPFFTLQSLFSSSSLQLPTHLSTAGHEASGTGSMKFLMNGCLLLATANGSTNEIIEEIGSENMSLMEGLESKDWLKCCDSLNDVWRLALYHSELLLAILEKVVMVLVKSMKNPRSALCKTAIMAAADIFKSFGDKLVESSTPNDVVDQMLFLDGSICNIQTTKLTGLNTMLVGLSPHKNGVDYALGSIHHIEEALSELRELVNKSKDI